MLFFMGMALVFANSFSMSPSLSVSAEDKSFMSTFSPEIQVAINDVIEMRTAFIIQKSYFALISHEISLDNADILNANNAFNEIKKQLNVKENTLKELLQSHVKVSKDGYYNYIFSRMKNFVNRLLGYQNTQVEQYISRKIVENLQQASKECIEQRRVLLFNKAQNNTAELESDIRKLGVLIEAINEAIYKLQPIASRMMGAIKNIFWRS
jgi:hypothetical protein